METKTKRLKQVFDNPAHVWAHPRQKDGSGFEQKEARVAGGNWYFKTSQDGTRVIYSYRDSYPIGARFEHGRKVIFLLRSGAPYSVTTSKHMNATRCAIPKNEPNVEVFTVPEMTGGWAEKPGLEQHAKNIVQYLADIQDAIEHHTKARSSYNIKNTLGRAQRLTDEVKRYARVFKLKLPRLPQIPKLDEGKLAGLIAREQAREALANAKRTAQHEAYERQHKAEVEAWETGPDACKHLNSAGKPSHSFSDRYSCQQQREREDWEANRADLIAAWKRGEDVTLRLNWSETALLRVKDGNVETSQHVSVPVSGRAGAARLFRFLLRLKETGQTFQTNGHKEHIGNFTVTSFDGELLVAGCHKITWQEVLSVSDEVLRTEQPDLVS